VHLASRGIEKLIKFDKFPNLEVLWINDNKVLLDCVFIDVCVALGDNRT
jgi:hypothetical protein